MREGGPDAPTEPGADRSLRILLNVRHLWYVRHFEELVRGLSEAGHHVRIVPHLARKSASSPYPQTLGSLPGVEIINQRPEPDRLVLLEAMRALRHYLRYLTPDFDGTEALAARPARRVPSSVIRLFERTKGKPSRWREVAESIARKIDEVSPATRDVAALVADYDPDVVLVTPLVDLAGEGAEFVKAARAQRRPTAVLVASWDNLTNKGCMPVVPDRVFVWNGVQADEATKLHDVASETVVVTGAQTFDEWFERRPKRTREEFLNAVGASPACPTIVYVCSSGFIGDEEPFIVDWVNALRNASDPRVRNANIIVRPHPQVDAGRLHDLEGKLSIVVWPRESTFVIGEDARQDYVDQLATADVVVGINTSALIEALIIGTPVLTVLDSRYGPVQEGTLHFRYLSQGDALQIDSSLSAHVERLEKVLSGDSRLEGRESFLRRFVRPFGLEERASPRLLEAVISLGDTVPRPSKPLPLAGLLVRLGGRVLLLNRQVREQNRRARGKGELPKSARGEVDETTAPSVVGASVGSIFERYRARRSRLAKLKNRAGELTAHDREAAARGQAAGEQRSIQSS